MTTFVDLNQPDEGLLGGALKKKARKGFEKGNRTEEALKVKLERRKGILNIDRMSWYPNWRDLVDHFRPYRGRWFLDSGDTNKGWRRNWRIVDSTPLQANNTLSAGLLAGVTPQTKPWATYTVADEEVLEAPGVKEWLDDSTKKGRTILSNSNFYDSMFECDGEFGVVGIIALGREWPLEDDVPHFMPFTIGSYYIGNDKHRQVNVFFRDFQWTVQQIVDKFATGPLDKESSWDNISLAVQAMWANEQYDKMIDLTHAVTENLDRKKGPSGDYLLSSEGMRFRSVYYERDGDPDKTLKDSDQEKEKRKVLRIKGFRDFPVFVARWYTNSEDAWGRGPAMDALGDARALQLQQKRKAQSIDRLVDPPMKAHPSLRNQRTSMLPGDVTFVAPEQGSVGFEPVYPNFKPDIQALLEDIKETQGRIDDIMGVKLFANFIDDSEESKQPITAAQVNVEQQEKLILLGPVLQNMNYGVLNPLLHWLLQEMIRRGITKPMPPALKKGQIKIEYSSMISQAINSLTVAAIQQFSQFVASQAQVTAQAAQNPAMDIIDFDQMIDEFAKATGIPPTIIRDDAVVQQIRAVRAKQQQQQQEQEAQSAQAQAALAHSGAIQNLSQSPMGGGGTALDSAIGAQPVAG